MSVNVPINVDEPAASIEAKAKADAKAEAMAEAAAIAAREHTERLQAQESAYHRSYLAGLCGEVGVSVPDASGVRGAKRVIKGQNCIKALKRIRKEVNLDSQDEKMETLVELGELRLMEELLLPMATGYSDDLILLKEITKLVVSLTMPPTTEHRDDPETDARKKYLEVSARAGHLRTYKAAFLRPGILSAFCVLLEEPLVVTAQSRTEDDKLIIELVLWLIRNLLCIPDCTSGIGVQANLHEQFVLTLERECVLDILVHLAECVGVAGNKDWNLILLECSFHLFRGSAPDEFFDAHTANNKNTSAPNLNSTGSAHKSTTSNATPPISANEATRSSSQRPGVKGRSADRGVQIRPDDQLGALLRAGNSRRSRGLGASSRHSRFGGAFQTKGTKAGASKPSRVFTLANGARGKEVQNSGRATGGKKRQDESEVSASVLAPTAVVRSLKLRLCLRKVCEELLNRAYGHLFQALIKDINHQDNRILPSDGIQFLWLASFCMRFQRIKLFYDDCAATDAHKLANSVVAIDLDSDSETEKDKTSNNTTAPQLPSKSFSWTKSPTFVNMDLWSFQYVIKSCQVHLDEKKWACLQVDMRALREMLHIVLQMQHSSLPDNVNRARTLQNSVFYELGELDVVSQILRMWEPGVHSRELLADVCILVDCLLQITTHMEEQGMVVQTARRRLANKKKKTKKQGAEWGAEETHALVEGVKEFGASGKAMRKMLAEASYRDLFADNQRTAKQLLARWADVGPALETGSSLEQFMQQEAEADLAAEAAARALAGGDDVDMLGDEGDTETVRKEPVIREQEMDSENFLRRFVGNQSVLNMCRVMDPALWESAGSVGANGSLREQLVLNGAVANFLRRAGGITRTRNSEHGSGTNLTKRGAGKVSNKKSTHKKKKQKRDSLGDSDSGSDGGGERESTDDEKAQLHKLHENENDDELESLEPILWHIETFGVFQRVLSTSNHLLVRARSEVPLCAYSVLREHADSLVNLLKITLGRFFKHAEKNPLVVIEALFWRTKGDNLSISTNYSDLKMSASSSLSTKRGKKTSSTGVALSENERGAYRNNRSDDDQSSVGESVADMDDLGIVGGRTTEAEWTTEEDEAIKQCYAGAVSIFGVSAAPRIIASHSTFRENRRSPAQVLARARVVLARSDGAASESNMPENIMQLLAGAELREWVERKVQAVIVPKTGALVRAARRLLSCEVLVEEGAAVLMFLKEQLVVASKQREISPSNAATTSRNGDKSFALVVPPRVGIREAWSHIRVVELLTVLGLRRPGRGERFWRVPAWYNSEALQKLSNALSQSVLGPDVAADIEDVSTSDMQTGAGEDAHMDTANIAPESTSVVKSVELNDDGSDSGFSDDDEMDVLSREKGDTSWKPPYFMSKIDTVAWMKLLQPKQAVTVVTPDSDEESVVNKNSGGEEEEDLTFGGDVRGEIVAPQTSSSSPPANSRQRLRVNEDNISSDESDDDAGRMNAAGSSPVSKVVQPKVRTSRMVVESDSESD